jgi:Bacterial PH domain
MKFAATISTSLKITTIVISIIFATCIIFCSYLFITDGAIVSLVIAIMLLALFATAYAFHPQYYVIEKDQILIKRLIGSAVIPKSAVQGVTLISQDMIAGSLRTFGVGGLFGNYGKFSNIKLGVMTWYMKRMDQPILITTTVVKNSCITG